jgi:hypothetical protein
LVVQSAEVEDLHHLGLVEGPFERAALDDVGEVEEGAGNGCARYAVHGRDIRGGEGERAVEVDPGVPARGPARDGLTR